MTFALDLAVGLVAGLLAALVTYRWPRLDPAEPTLSPGFVADQVAEHPGLRARLRRHADPRAVMGQLLVALFVGVIAMGALFGLVAVMVRTNTGFAEFDQRAAEFGSRHASSWSIDALEKITLLGGFELGVVIVVAIVVLEVRRTRGWTAPAFLVVCAVGQNIITNTIKVIVERARPSIDQLSGFSGYSFPSGHSSSAAAIFAAVALLLGRGRGRTVHAILAGAAVGIATCVATSRVMLGVHWLTDVIGGLAVGWGWFALVSMAFGGRWLHFGAPVEAAKLGATLPGGTVTHTDRSAAQTTGATDGGKSADDAPTEAG